MMQPLLGTFSLDLKEFLRKAKERIEQKAKEIEAQTGGLKKVQQITMGDVVDDDDLEENEEEKQGLLEQATKAASKHFGLEIGNVDKATGEIVTTKVEGVKPILPDGQSPNISSLLPVSQIVIKPKYINDTTKGYEIEKDKPNPNLYLELGHDSKERKEKHYRYYLDKPLEDTDILNKTPFDEIPIKRGSAVDDDSLFAKIFGKNRADDENVRESETVGFFKAMITILTEEEKKEIDEKAMNKMKANAAKLSASEHDAVGIPDVDFLKKSDCIVRVYMIDAIGLADKDENSNSDPYLILELGDTVYDERRFYQDDEPNPKFNKVFEFPATLPGDGLLRIKVMDHDPLKRDDLIGETTIDIEDRWFSKRWRKLEEVPIETREIYNPISRVPQGAIRLFVEIFPREEKTLRKKWDLTPRPPKEFELRLVVWDCEEMPGVDGGMVDLYISAKMDDGTKLVTDTHWRSQNGKGAFNWRMVFKTQFPAKTNRISLQAWDKDVISANDFISEGTLDYTELAEEAFLYNQAVTMKGPKESNRNQIEKYDKVKIQLYRKKKNDDQGQLEKAGFVNVSLEILPIEIAKLNKVGQGRSDPNQAPFLAPPIGRIKFSLNPLDMWENYVGPVHRRQIYLCCCVMIFLMLILISIPSIVGSLVTKAIL